MDIHGGATIKNITISGDISSTGRHVGSLVSNLSGSSTIDNCTSYVNITQNNTISGHIYAGGIAGLSNGTIKNSKNYGKIITVSTQGNCNTAGICGRSQGTIENCCNMGQISGNSINQQYSYVGGIAGISGDNGLTIGVISKCYNGGKIEGNASITPIVGGISAVNYYKVQNSYNNGEISSLKSSSFVGGVVGDNYGDTAITEKCYSINNIIVNSVNTGKVVGNHIYNSTTKNCYGPSSYSTVSGGSANIIECELKPEVEMKNQNFVDLLNSGQVDTPWLLDTGINNGFPILKWQI